MDRHLLVILLATFIGAATAGLAWARESGQMTAWFNEKHRTTVVLFPTAMLIGWTVFHLGMRQFGGFDCSVLVDIGWRLAKGQQPYRDFPCTVPAIFWMGAGQAFALFGVAWRSFVLLMAIFAGSSFFWSYWLLVRILGVRARALLLAVAMQAMTTILVAYWWYNPVTTICTALFALSALLLVREPRGCFAAISYVMSLTSVALCKPNLAGPAIVLVGIILLIWRPTRWITIGLSAAAGFVCYATLWLHGVSITDVLSGYLSVSGRGLSGTQFLQDMSFQERVFSVTALLCLLLPLLQHLLTSRPVLLPRSPTHAICLALVAIGLIGFATNGELKLVDTVLPLIGAWLYIHMDERTNTRPDMKGSLVFFTVVLIFTALGEAVTRHRVKAIGPFFEYHPSKAFADCRFFDGLHCGPMLQQTVQDVGAVLAHNPRSSVWFGPRMQWCYATFDRPSPVGLPIWWHPGVSFAPRDERAFIQHWRDHRFDLCIFLKNDFTYYSQEFMTLLSGAYVVDNQSYSELTVLLRACLKSKF